MTRIRCHLASLLVRRGMTLTELSERAGVTVVNLSVLKNNRAKAVRFTTLTAVCAALGCQVGDLLTIQPDTKPDATQPKVPSTSSGHDRSTSPLPQRTSRR